jgi:murein L,D-transpeptidase YafK
MAPVPSYRRPVRARVLHALAALLLAGALPPAAAHAQIPHFVPKPLLKPTDVDLVVVRKSARELQLIHEGRVLKSYRIALGRDPDGPKRKEGDGRTPEGVYTLDWRNSRSDFYRSIHVSYPRAGDDEHARRWGVSAGGQIMLHGLPNGIPAERVGHPYVDWTNGCIALTNEEIDEIWMQVADGTTIIIYP